MAFLTEPAHTPQQLRENAYDRACLYCGGTVRSGQGMAFLLWSDYAQKNKWEAACHGDTAPVRRGDALVRAVADGDASCLEMLMYDAKARELYYPPAP